MCTFKKKTCVGRLNLEFKNKPTDVVLHITELAFQSRLCIKVIKAVGEFDDVLYVNIQAHEQCFYDETAESVITTEPTLLHLYHAPEPTVLHLCHALEPTALFIIMINMLMLALVIVLHI
jgi:hypothetical protein